MEGNCDILVAGASSDREAASVVGEELAEQFCYHKNLLEGIATGGGRTTRCASKVSFGFVDRIF